MTLAEFVSKYNGVHIDEDGYYGAQCWDVSARYAREVVGCPSFPTGSGGAEGLYRIFADPIPQYFDRIANNKSDPNQLPAPGDVIVWDASFSPPWGHTAVCISADASGVTVIEQNGNNPGGAAYIKKRGWTGVSGWLRPKGSSMATDKLTKEEVIEIHRAYFLGDPGPGYGWEHVGQPLDKIIHDFKDASYRQTVVQRFNDFPALASRVDDLAKQLADLQSKFDELIKVDKLKDDQIKDLTAKLSVQTDDTKLLNGFGEWLQKLIIRLGVKKV